MSAQHLRREEHISSPININEKSRHWILLVSWSHVLEPVTAAKGNETLWLSRSDSYAYVVPWNGLSTSIFKSCMWRVRAVGFLKGKPKFHKPKKREWVLGRHKTETHSRCWDLGQITEWISRSCWSDFPVGYYCVVRNNPLLIKWTLHMQCTCAHHEIQRSQLFLQIWVWFYNGFEEYLRSSWVEDYATPSSPTPMDCTWAILWETLS